MPNTVPGDPGREPLVSVVCTAYNRGPAIRPTLASVLAQDLGSLELLVISDGSTDDTDEHVADVARQDHRVTLIAVENGGAQRAMNLGVEAARGRYLAYLDHDDLWTPDHLRLLAAELDAGADLAATNSTWIRPDGSVLSERPAASLFWHPEIQVVNPVFENSQAMHRAELIDEVGPWREEPYGLEDWDLWLRMADAGARVATLARRTVRETMGEHNRFRTLSQRHSMELVRCPDQLSARRALRAMAHPETSARLQAAAVADSEAWHCRLAQEDAFVFPRGFAASRDEAVARVPEALRESRAADEGHADPVSIRIVPSGEGVAVVQDLNCMTAEHAARYAEVMGRAMPRYAELVAEVTAPYALDPVGA